MGEYTSSLHPKDILLVKGWNLTGKKTARAYGLVSRLGAGSFGETWSAMATNRRKIFTKFSETDHSKFVALKLESRKLRPPQLIDEAKMYLKFSNFVGFPLFHAYGIASCKGNSSLTFNSLVMEKLGPNLENIFNWCNRQFTLKTTLMIGEQMITRVEMLHSLHFIHRDIKPDNFVMGEGRKSNIVYMIDFGLIKQFETAVRRIHIPYKENKGLTGTARYASAGAQKGNEQSRRDDLEAVLYCFIYFMRGGLPWQGIQARTKKEKHEKMAEIKSTIKGSELCASCPVGFVTYLQYCRKLGFTETPDYRYLRGLLSQMYKEYSLERDWKWDWYVHATKSGMARPMFSQAPAHTHDQLATRGTKNTRVSGLVSAALIQQA